MAQKKLVAADLQKKSIKDLVKLRNEMRKKLFDLRMQNKMRALKETDQIRKCRRNIARVSTILSTKLQETHGDSSR